MGVSAIYVVRPEVTLSQPQPDVIQVAATRVWLCDRIVEYRARQIELLQVPSDGAVYYVTIQDHDQTGDIEGQPDHLAVALPDHRLVGELGHIYMGAIAVSQEGGSQRVGTAGWPNPYRSTSGV